ncbi:MAG: FixH family protein [Chloroflexi bacterium]|nr:FixH family protein [Chloroflexota bacterium]
MTAQFFNVAFNRRGLSPRAPDGVPAGAQAKAQGLVGSAAAFIIAAGVIHLLIAPLHGAHAPAHGWFHLLSGAAQVLWGIAFWRRPSIRLMRVGVLLAGSLITLYGVTRLWPAPFTHDIEEIDLYGIATKACEGLGVAALIALMSTAAARGTRARRSAMAILGAALMLGLFAYGAASAAEPLFPWLGEGLAGVASPTEQAVGGNDNLQWALGGITQPFQPGAEIALTGDVLASVTVNRSAGQRGQREIDVQLYHTTTANPIDDADVQAVTQMRYMDHGQSKTIALRSSGGHYLLPVQFAMPGEYQVNIVINTAGKQTTLQLYFDLFE